MKKLTGKKTETLEFRGAQLDLARQLENLDYIESFIDFISQNGYNYLVLYLEGRIKTASFPYRKDSESYSSEDIKRIVAYADKKNIDVVPVVSVLGHAEHFLSCPELEHLGELRGDVKGRFSTFKHVFCPTVKETNEFLEKYLTEVAELFPSNFFHAGFDEAWDIGYCELCKERLKTETQADIFQQQILDCYNIVVTKLNKRMLIWDDLFDIYPEALADIPRDVIMCSWHYDKLVERPSGHCGGPRKDIAALYDELGFDYIFAPASFSIRNVETFSDYAMDKKTLGGLLTSWERETGFLLQNYPTIAYAGRLWRGDADNRLNVEFQVDVIREVTGCQKDELIQMIRTMLNARLHTLPNNQQVYLKGALTDEEYDRKSLVDSARIHLNPFLSVPTDGSSQSYILNDIAVCVEIEALYFELRETLPKLYTFLDNSRKQAYYLQLNECIIKLEEIKAIRKLQWEIHRHEIPGYYLDYYDSIIDMVQNALTDSKKVNAVLNIMFQSAGGNIDILVCYENENEWEQVAGGGFSNNPYHGPYQYSFPILSDRVPTAIRLEASGYVGSGIIYLEYKTMTECFVPASLSALEGTVEHPEHLLENGRDWCFLGDGEQDARRKYNAPALAQVKNSIQINLAKINRKA